MPASSCLLGIQAGVVKKGQQQLEQTEFGKMMLHSAMHPHLATVIHTIMLKLQEAAGF
jgi:hypothetical protein